MKKTVILFFILIFLFLNCKSYDRFYVRENYTKINTGLIAVMDFKNRTDYVNAGKIVSEILRTELYVNGYKLIPYNEILKIIKQKNINLDEYIENSKFEELGKLLNVNSIIIGSVSEYRYKHGLGDNPAIGINLRMLNTITNTVVWANSYSSSGSGAFFMDISINELTQKICKKMVSDLNRSIE